MTKQADRTRKLRPWPLHDRPGYLIRRLHQIHVALFSAACREFDITPIQYSLLSALAPEACDQTTLAQSIAVDRVTATGALTRLVARGLVERGVSARDRRSRLCKITVAGRDLLHRIEPRARLAHLQTVAALRPAERRVLMSALKSLVQAHETLD